MHVGNIQHALILPFYLQCMDPPILSTTVNIKLAQSWKYDFDSKMSKMCGDSDSQNYLLSETLSPDTQICFSIYSLWRTI